jgi:hypothetical protein
MELDDRYCLRLPTGMKEEFLALARDVERRDGADVLRLYMEDMIHQWKVDKALDLAKKRGASSKEIAAIIKRGG